MRISAHLDVLLRVMMAAEQVTCGTVGQNEAGSRFYGVCGRPAPPLFDRSRDSLLFTDKTSVHVVVRAL